MNTQTEIDERQKKRKALVMLIGIVVAIILLLALGYYYFFDSDYEPIDLSQATTFMGYNLDDKITVQEMKDIFDQGGYLDEDGNLKLVVDHQIFIDSIERLRSGINEAKKLPKSESTTVYRTDPSLKEKVDKLEKAVKEAKEQTSTTKSVFESTTSTKQNVKPENNNDNGDNDFAWLKQQVNSGGDSSNGSSNDNSSSDAYSNSPRQLTRWSWQGEIGGAHGITVNGIAYISKYEVQAVLGNNTSVTPMIMCQFTQWGTNPVPMTLDGDWYIADLHAQFAPNQLTKRIDYCVDLGNSMYLPDQLVILRNNGKPDLIGNDAVDNHQNGYNYSTVPTGTLLPLN